MKFEKIITLTAYEVEYIDQRQPKPRTVHRETVILDGGMISAIERLGMRPNGYICRKYEAEGYTVANIHKGEKLTAYVDLEQLWKETSQAVELEQLRRTVQTMEETSQNSAGEEGKELDAIYKASHHDTFGLAFNMFNIGFMRGIRCGKAMAKKQWKGEKR